MVNNMWNGDGCWNYDARILERMFVDPGINER
jgi:hypothetical protein